MRRFAGACRFVFNRALALQNENHEAGNKYIPYGKMASWLVEWKNATVSHTATAFPYHKYPQGLPSQSHNDNQQKPRNDSH